MIVITGAAGFIGSNLVHGLNALGHKRLVLVDWLQADNRWQNLVGASFLDFLFPEALPDFLARQGKQVTAILHLGANSSTTAADGDAILRTNLHPSMQLWRWAAEAGKTLIYASSAATYGGGEAGFDDCLELADLAKLKPLNLYGWSKQAFDVWALERTAEGQAPPAWAGLKFFNVYGPREAHKGDMMSVVSKNIRPVSEGRAISLFKSHREGFADGQQLRDFVYVKDCVDVIAWLMAQLPTAPDGARNGLYNVGTGAARSFRDLIRATGAALSRDVDIAYVDMPLAIRDRYQYFTQARMSKLRKAGYTASFRSIDDGVKDFAAESLIKS